MNTRPPGCENVARIQLFVDEEVNTARSYIRDISHHLPGKLALNAEIPNIRFRVVQIWQNRGLSRQRIGCRRFCWKDVRCVSKTPDGVRCIRSKKAGADSVRRRSDSVAKNVVEVDVVIHSEAAADYSCVLAQ